MTVKFICFNLLVIILPGSIFSQSDKIDSLKHLLDLDTLDHSQVYNELARTYLPDSLDATFHYANKALRLSLDIQNNQEIGNAYDVIGDFYYYKNDFTNAQKFYKQSLSTLKKTEDKKGIAREYHNLGIVYYFLGEYHNSISSSREAYDIRKNLGESHSIANSLFNIALIHKKWGNYEEAIQMYEKAREVYEEHNDKLGIGNSLTNMANVYRNKGEYKKAIEQYIEALEIYENIEHLEGKGNILSNLSLVYRIWGYYEKAIECLEQALDIFTELNIQSRIAYCYTNLGVTYMRIEDYNTAFFYMNKSIEIKKEIEDQPGLIISYLDIGSNYSKIGEYEKAYEYYKQAQKIAVNIGDRKNTSFALHNLGMEANNLKHYSEAADYLRKSIRIAEEIGQSEMIMLTCFELAQSMYGLGDNKNAIRYLKRHRSMKDSIFAENTRTQVSELQTRYETEKKDKEIIILKKDRELLEMELIRKKQYIKRRNIIIVICFTALLIVSGLSVILFRLFRDKKHSNVRLKEQNTEILGQNKKIENQRDKIVVQRDELVKQRDLANKQKELILYQKEEITESIDYARIIQNAVLPPKSKMDKYLGKYYLIHKTRYRVSSDFYWLAEHRNKIYVAVADSISTDIPGALMSMLGIAILSDIVHQKKNYSADEVLNQMRKNLVRSLHLNEEIEADTKDGINIALCVLDKDENLIEFAGANMSLVTINEKGVRIFEADQMPVGLSSRMIRMFRLQKFKRDSNSTLLLHTHGLRRMFNHDQLISIYDGITEIPFELQHEFILKRIEQKISAGKNWKDVLLLGFQFD